MESCVLRYMLPTIRSLPLFSNGIKGYGLVYDICHGFRSRPLNYNFNYNDIIIQVKIGIIIWNCKV